MLPLDAAGVVSAAAAAAAAAPSSGALAGDAAGSVAGGAGGSAGGVSASAVSPSSPHRAPPPAAAPLTPHRAPPPAAAPLSASASSASPATTLAVDPSWPPAPASPPPAAPYARGGGLRAGLVSGAPAWAPSAARVTDAAGVVLLLHGCGHTGEVWATGAEERPVVRALLARGLFPLALSSAGECWEPDDAAALVAAAHAARAAAGGAAALPVFALGASSGGAMAAALTGALRLAGVASYIMPLPPGVSSGGGAGGVRGAAAALPPFLFLHMPRDAFTARGVESGVAALLARGPGGGAPAARALELLPRRVDGSTLHGAMPWLVSPGLSAAVFTALLRTPGALTHDAAAGRGGAPARDPPLGDPAGGMWVAADPRGDAVRRAVLSVVDAHGGRLTTRAGDDGHPVFDVSPERQDRQPSLILPPGSGGGGVVPPPLEPARDAATIAARAAVLAAAEGVRILQRNVLEVLNERYAEHEMSAQHAEVVAETLAGWAEAARGRGG